MLGQRPHRDLHPGPQRQGLQNRLQLLVVRRPEVGQRDLPEEAVLDQVTGLEGDNWLSRGSSSTPDGSAHPDKQVTVINARLAELVAGGTERMALAGDQLDEKRRAIVEKCLRKTLDVWQSSSNGPRNSTG